MFVDSHCHLDYRGLVEDQAAAVDRARRAGVVTMVNIATRQAEWDSVVATAERYSGVWASIGIHPHEADAHSGVDTALLVARAAHPKVVAIGETGLDYHYDHSDRDRQRTSFRAHIAAARETGLPVIVHTRAAEAETALILTEEMTRGAFTGVIHCFTASAEFAETVLVLGLYISIAGIVTFKNAKDLQAVVRQLPEQRLLIETDAPFLSPVPHRGRPGEPAFVVDTARFIADLRGTAIEAFAATTTANFERLFKKAMA